MRYVVLMGQVRRRWSSGSAPAAAVVRRLPRLPRPDGRRERGRQRRLLIDTIIPLTGLDRPARRGHRRGRRRLRRGPRDQPAGAGLPRSTLRRLRLQRGGPRGGPRRGRGLGADQRPLRDPRRRRRSTRGAASTWSRRSTRSTTRPTPRPCSRTSTAPLRPGGTLPDGRHQRVQQPRGQPGPAVGLVPLRRLDAALHVGLARPGRRRARHGLGRPDRRADGARGRLRRRGRARPRGRPVQRLLRGAAP